VQPLLNYSCQNENLNLYNLFWAVSVGAVIVDVGAVIVVDIGVGAVGVGAVGVDVGIGVGVEVGIGVSVSAMDGRESDISQHRKKFSFRREHVSLFVNNQKLKFM